ncbi:MAG: hypothetical protein IOD12_12965 [Silvanigrellales bacterium]|jgi:hypothetical protein|nr:hypothetical protein [Silvanigrellales bacterium]
MSLKTMRACLAAATISFGWILWVSYDGSAYKNHGDYGSDYDGCMKRANYLFRVYGANASCKEG